MRPVLPSDFCRKWLGLVIILLVGCRHAAPPPVAPGEPIPAAQDIAVDTMEKECANLIAAIQAFGDCPNGDEDTREWARRVVEIAQEDIDAGKKGAQDEPTRHVIALACRKAAVSMQNATLRCAHGPRPKDE
ncbi:MAG TPA: hypothetical protein VGL61_35225 [Kofleriaceae bacterium]|jgi:RNA polymerase subunit RPABC4/transcription elongation factor Spt4